MRKVNQYNQETTEPYNWSWNKVEEEEGLTVVEQALFFSKVENLELNPAFSTIKKKD